MNFKHAHITGLALFLGGVLPGTIQAAGVADIPIVFAHPQVQSGFNIVSHAMAYPPGSDAGQHGTFTNLVAEGIVRMTVTWANPKSFRTEEETRDFLRDWLSSTNTTAFTFHIWSQGDGTPDVVVTVERSFWRSGQWLIWGDRCACQDAAGKWWWAHWDSQLDAQHSFYAPVFRKIARQLPPLMLVSINGDTSSSGSWDNADYAATGFFLWNESGADLAGKLTPAMRRYGVGANLKVTIVRYASAHDAEEAVRKSLGMRQAAFTKEENNDAELYAYRDSTGGTQDLICQSDANIIEIQCLSDGVEPLTAKILDAVLAELNSTPRSSK